MWDKTFFGLLTWLFVALLLPLTANRHKMSCFIHAVITPWKVALSASVLTTFTALVISVGGPRQLLYLIDAQMSQLQVHMTACYCFPAARPINPTASVDVTVTTELWRLRKSPSSCLLPSSSSACNIMTLLILSHNLWKLPLLYQKGS